MSLFNKYSRSLRIALIAIGSLALLTLGLQFFFQHRVNQFLNQNTFVKNYIDYNEVSTNILLRQVTFKKLTTKKKIPLEKHIIKLNVNTLQFSDIGIWRLLTDKEINIGDVSLNHPIIKLVENVSDGDIISDTSTEKKSIRIKNLTVQKGSFLYVNSSEKDTLLSAEEIEIGVSKIRIKDGHSPKYELSHAGFKNLNYPLNEYYDLGVKRSLFQKDQATLFDIKIQTKYSKESLSTRIVTERDHIDLKIPKIQVDGFHPAIDSTFGLYPSKISFDEPVLRMYRDKLLPDNKVYKPLYTELLRNLQFPLHIPNLEIVNGALYYAEKTDANLNAETLYFEKINALLKGITTVENKPLDITAEGQLMGDANLQVHWTFANPLKNDAFLTKGVLKQFNTKKLNPFLRTNMGAEVDGTVNKLYFTFSGNNYVANGDMKMSYDNFEFKVLKKDLLGVNKLLTAIVGIFTDDGSETDADGYRYGAIETERDNTKSFFNYQWLALKSGLLDTVTGDGKKED